MRRDLHVSVRIHVEVETVRELHAKGEVIKSFVLDHVSHCNRSTRGILDPHTDLVVSRSVFALDVGRRIVIWIGDESCIHRRGTPGCQGIGPGQPANDELSEIVTSVWIHDGRDAQPAEAAADSSRWFISPVDYREVLGNRKFLLRYDLGKHVQRTVTVEATSDEEYRP